MVGGLTVFDMRFLWLGVKIPSCTDRCQQGSVCHNNGLWQLEINRRLQFWRKHPPQCYRSKKKIPELSKSLYINCCDFFYTKDFVGRIVLCCSTLHLFDLQIFLITMPQEAKKGTCQGGTSIWASKRTLQANVLSVHCLQTNEKPRDKMGIHLGCSTAHGHTKLIPHWNPQFHQIFNSSVSSKTKTDKEFSCLFTFHLDIEKNSLSTTTAN